MCCRVGVGLDLPLAAAAAIPAHSKASNIHLSPPPCRRLCTCNFTHPHPLTYTYTHANPSPLSLHTSSNRTAHPSHPHANFPLAHPRPSTGLCYPSVTRPPTPPPWFRHGQRCCFPESQPCRYKRKQCPPPPILWVRGTARRTRHRPALTSTTPSRRGSQNQSIQESATLFPQTATLRRHTTEPLRTHKTQSVPKA